jgi:hypothetical protein
VLRQVMIGNVSIGRIGCVRLVSVECVDGR